MRARNLALALAMLTSPLHAESGIEQIIGDDTPGYYNDSLGRILDGTDPGFPATGGSLPDAPEPSLDAAARVLGNWLASPPELNDNWSELQQIPFGWTARDETAVVYPFGNDSTSWTDVTIAIGVDNGAFVWLDGQYLGGQTMPGGVALGELTIELSKIGPGEHVLQVIREDHGGATGFRIDMTGIPSEPCEDTTPGFVAACEAVTLALPPSSGDGLFVEVFNGIGGGAPPRPADLWGRDASGTMLSPFIDFPSPGNVVSVGESFAVFFSETTVPPDEVANIPAANFILRITGLLRISRDLDLDPKTPAIDVGLGVGSDDGFHLIVGDTFIDEKGDRSFNYGWSDVDFETEGLYPITLLFAANAWGASGLELVWQTAIAGEEIIPQEALYLGEAVCESKIEFEEFEAGTIVGGQYRDLGLQFEVISGDLQITDAFPDEFVPVSGDRVFGDPNDTPAAEGVVEFAFVVPGTDEPASTDFFSFFLIDAEGIGSTITAFAPDGSQIFAEQVNAGGGTQEPIAIIEPFIAKVRVSLGVGDDTSAIDNICFREPTSMVAPDLQVDQLDVPDQGLVGQDVAVTWIVANRGLASASGPWTDTLYLSADDQVDGADTVLGTITHDSPLAPGSKYGGFAEVRLPTQPGDYWIIVETDSADVVSELGGEGNNTRVDTVRVDPIPFPDLVVEWVSRPTSPILSGSSIEIEYVVRNVGGTKTSELWQDLLILSIDQELVEPPAFLRNETILSQHTNPQFLPPGEAYSNVVEVMIPNDIVGPFYFAAYADGRGNGRNGDVFDLIEMNEGNNLRFSEPFDIELEPQPDLVATNIQIPRKVFSGSDLTVDWIVENRGDGITDSGQFANAIYLSKNDAPEITPGDLPFASTGLSNIPPLQPGQSHPFQVSAEIPVDLFGTFHVKVLADSTDTISEFGLEGNNVGVSLAAMEIILSPAPDLVASDIAASPTSPYPGQQILVTWSANNKQGAPPAFPVSWEDAIYLSADATFDPAIDQRLGAIGHASTTDGNGQPTIPPYQKTRSVGIPSDTAPGDHYLFVRLDDRNEVFEGFNGGESNNTLISDPIAITLEQHPDLVVEAVFPPSSGVLSGGTVEVEYVVRNIGNLPTIPIWKDLLILSVDQELVEPPAFLSNEAILSEHGNPRFLLPGESYRNTVAVTLPNDLPGIFHVAAYADGRGAGRNGAVFAMAEMEEGNNVRFSSPFEIMLEPQPDLVVRNIEIPETVFSATSLAIGWTAENQGEGVTDSGQFAHAIYLSSNRDPEITSDDILFRNTGLSNILPLQPGQTHDFVASDWIPPGLSGNYHVKVLTDASDTISEFGLENNNVGVSESTMEVILSAAPDLVPTGIVANALSPYPGQLVSVTWSADNELGAPPPFELTWNDAVYLSSDGTLDIESDILLGTFARQSVVDEFNHPAIDPYERTANVRLPDDLLPGDYRVIISVDDGNTVFEGIDGGEGNNSLATSRPLTVVDQYANLTIATTRTPEASGPAGGSISLGWEVTNVGNAVTPTSLWRDRIYFSSDTTVDDGDPILLTRLHNASLQPEDSYAESEIVTIPLLPPGDYHLLIATDADNDVLEGQGGATDNLLSMPFEISGDACDLVVQSADASRKGTSGETILVDWVVRNMGTLPTNVAMWQDRVWLSVDQRLGDDEDILLGTRTHSGALDVDGQYEVADEFPIPISLTGTFFVLVETDPQALVFEIDDQNNLGIDPSPLVIGPAALGNLVVGGLEVGEPAVSGQPVQISWTVSNEGDGPTNVPSWYDSIYLSRDQFFDGSDDIHLGTIGNGGAPLGVGEEYDRTHSFSVPLGVSGPFFVIARTDSSDAVYEGGLEIDNTDVTSSLIQFTLPEPADLTAGIFMPPSGPITLGDLVTFEWSVGNIGDSAVVGGWKDALYLSTDPFWDLDDTRIGTFQSSTGLSGPLAPGGTLQSSAVAAIPGVMPGDYFVLLRTDVYNNVLETDESNNCCGFSMSPVRVGAIPLALSEPEQPMPFEGTLQQGQGRYFELVTPSDESVNITLDHDSPTAWTELYVKFGSVPSPADFDFRFENPGLPDQQIVIPNTLAGTYYILAKATAGTFQPDGVSMSLLAERLPFSIQSVTPTVVGAGRVTVLLEGSRWTEETEFSIRLGDMEILPESVAIINATSARVTFDLSAIPYGVADVVAQGSSGSDELEGGIEVVAPSEVSVHANVEGMVAIRRGTESSPVVILRNNSNVNARFVSVDIGGGRSYGTRLEVITPNEVLVGGGDGLVSRVGPIYFEDLGPSEEIRLPMKLFVSSDYDGESVFAFAKATAWSPEEFVDNKLLNWIRAVVLDFASRAETLPPDEEIVEVVEFFRAEFIEALEGGYQFFGVEGGTGLARGVTGCELSCSSAWVLKCSKCSRAPHPWMILGCSLACGTFALYYCDFLCDELEDSYENDDEPGDGSGEEDASDWDCTEPPWVCSPIEPDCPDDELVPEDCPQLVRLWNPVQYRDGLCWNPRTGVMRVCYASECVPDDFLLDPDDCVPVLQSMDPNEKVGPIGFGGRQWVDLAGELGYVVFFENLSEATAPAARLELRDEIDSSLNAASVRLGDIRIGDVLIDVPYGTVNYSATVDFVEKSGVLIDLFAGVNAGVSPPEAFWILQAIDPETGEPPTDAFAGFLPPEDGSGAGQGSVSFTIKPKLGMVTGTVVENTASIIFDNNEPIITNTVFNTIDADLPESVVQALPPVVDGPDVVLAYSGQDPAGGSGLAGFNLLVSIDGSSMVPFAYSAETTAVYPGEPGHVYGFSSQAVDNAGNVEVMGQSPDVLTVIPDVGLAADSDSGIAGDNITNDSTPTIVVVSAPMTDVLVEIIRDGVGIKTAVPIGANGRGTFTVPDKNVLSDGEYRMTATSSNVVVDRVLRIDTTPPVVSEWSSMVAHAEAGESAILIREDGTSSEPRKTGISTLLLSYPTEESDVLALQPDSIEVEGRDAEGKEIDLSGVATAITLRRDENRHQITFTPALPDKGVYCIKLIGVTDRAGNMLPAASAHRVLAGLVGDATGDQRVNSTDVGGVLSLVGVDPIDSANSLHIASDLDADGDIDDTDVQIALEARGTDLRFVGSPCGASPLAVSGQLGTTTAGRDGFAVSSADRSPGELSGAFAGKGEPRADGDLWALDAEDLAESVTTPSLKDRFPLPPIDLATIGLHDPTGRHDVEAIAERLGFTPESLNELPVAGWWTLELSGHDATDVGQRALVEEWTKIGLFATPSLVGEDGAVVLVSPTLLVCFEPGTSDAEASQLLRTADAGMTILDRRTAGVDGLVSVGMSFRSGFDVLQAVEFLNGLDTVRFAEPDAMFSGWHSVIGTPSPGEARPAMVRGAAHHAPVQGGLVVIIDDGVEGTTVAGTDFTSGPNRRGAPVSDGDAGGTIVAGCVLEASEGASRIASARVLVTADDGRSWLSRVSWNLHALDWAEDLGADVTNNSNTYGFASAAIAEKYRLTSGSGLLHFAMIGDDPARPEPAFPARLDEVHGVGAIDESGCLATFSANGASFVEVGVQVSTLDRPGDLGLVPGDRVRLNGTGLASARVAGAAAAVARPTDEVGRGAALLDSLRASCRDLGAPGFDPCFGWGLPSLQGDPLEDGRDVLTDVDRDGTVTMKDLARVLEALGGTDEFADVDRNGRVDELDVIMVIEDLDNAGRWPSGEE